MNDNLSRTGAGLKHEAVLIIEDDPVQLEIMRAMTKRLGRRSFGAKSVNEARAMLGDARITTILLDLQLGEDAGLDLLCEIGAIHSPRSLIFTSGCDVRTRTAAARLASQHGVHVAGTLGKPVRLEDLVSLLEEVPRHVKRTPAADLPTLSIDDIRAAMELGDIQPSFQPKVSLRTGETVGVEALARWSCRRLGNISPARFIPVLENAGGLRLLTHTMLAASLSACNRWRTRWPSVTVAVNVSPLIIDQAFLRMVFKALESSGVPAQSLVLEVTESNVLSDSLEVSDVLTRLRIAGVQLSIDDFGTGYSSLVPLLRLPFNELKLDRLFVANALQDADAVRILRAMVALGTEMGLRSVAEGIETAAVRERVASLGCEVGQGWFWAPALTEKELGTWLERQVRPAI